MDPLTAMFVDTSVKGSTYSKSMTELTLYSKLNIDEPISICKQLHKEHICVVLRSHTDCTALVPHASILGKV